MQLLARSKDIAIVQANVRKCFDNIHHLRLGDPPQTSGGAVATVSGLPIDAMVSLTTRWPVPHGLRAPQYQGREIYVSTVLLVSP